MKIPWRELEGSIHQLQERERRLLCITVVVVIMLVAAMLAWEPLYRAGIKSYEANRTIIGEISRAQTSIVALEARAKFDVNAQNKQQVSALKGTLGKQQQQIESLTSALIAPKNMGRVFDGLLQENALSMHEISNLDAVAVNIEGQQGETNLLYQHGLSLQLKGQYMNAVKYIQGIEEQDWQLYWDELIFRTDDYPQGTLTIEVHTLSTGDSLLDL